MSIKYLFLVSEEPISKYIKTLSALRSPRLRVFEGAQDIREICVYSGDTCW